MPRIGERLHIYALARFYRTLGMLLNSGMGIEFALAMAGDLLPGTLQAKFIAASRDIESGLSIAQAMDRNGLSTEIAQSLLRVGEQGGNMGEMMERIAVFYDDEMSRWIDWATRLFEPILMAGIGGVIGGIVVMLYLPIFELAGRIQ
jgi:general secretion pathway protein F